MPGMDRYKLGEMAFSPLAFPGRGAKTDRTWEALPGLCNFPSTT